MPIDSTQYPYCPVVFITDDIGGDGFRASGVLIAPDEVLTASHVVYRQDLGVADNIVVTPGYDNGAAPFGSAAGVNVRYNPVADAGGRISNSDSQNDYAVIHLDHPIYAAGTMGLEADFTGGSASVTGYPAAAGGVLVSTGQTVSKDPYYDLLDGAPLGPGSSGGPVWTTGANGLPYVVGVVSSENNAQTIGYNALITTAAFDTIQSWVEADDGTPAALRCVVRDTAADVANSLPQLEAEAQQGVLASVTLIDPTPHTLAISLDQLLGSADALGLIGGSFTVDVSPTGVRGDLPALQAVNFGARTGLEDVQFADGQVVYDPAAPVAQVVRLYQAAFGRAPDQPGLHLWTNLIKAGTPLTAIADGFIGSTEFQQRFGAGTSDGAFVDQLYQTILHRAPDTSGDAIWTNALAGGVTRGQALAAFSDSGENKLATAGTVQSGIWDLDQNAPQIARLYDTVFGRLPDAGGLRTWDKALDAHALTLDQVAGQFMQTPEFAREYGAPSDPAFVDALYVNALHRAPDANGVALWTDALASGGVSRSAVVVGFSESPEHQNSTAANILGSDPASFGIKLA